MKFLTLSQPLAWLTVVLTGVVAPALSLVVLMNSPSPTALFGGPILALGLMGGGMITAAAAGSLWVGTLFALLNGACLLLLARALGIPTLEHPLSIGLAFIIASISFAARGALFARSARDKGWVIALFVVAGEAAILITASAVPGLWPAWLLVLLPAQWANIAIQTALTGAGTLAAIPVLLALAGTAVATLLVAWLWPRRWPYFIMFTTWLALSAFVWHWSEPPAACAEFGIVAPTNGPTGYISITTPDRAASDLPSLPPFQRLRPGISVYAKIKCKAGGRQKARTRAWLFNLA